MTTATGGYMLSGSIGKSNERNRRGKSAKTARTNVARLYIVRAIVFALTFVLMFVFGAIFSSYAADEQMTVESVQLEAPHYAKHIVEQGETLWSIAKLYATADDDIRQFIHEIRLASGLDSALLSEGRVLQIPLAGR